jgi:hypothetical protein
MENQQRMKIDISDAPWAECCGEPQLFETAFMFKRISPIVSPSGKEEHVPIEIVICKKCGKVPQFILKNYPDLPDSLKANSSKLINE